MSEINHKGVSLNLTYPIFADQVKPKGYLEDHKACHACWYYYTLATKAKELVGDGPESQIILEGEPWLDKEYYQQKRSVGTLYGIDPAEMDKFWGHVIQEARRLGLPEPAGEIMLRQRIIIN